MKEPYLNRKCALYLRVSTDQQALDGESLEEQEERLRAFCKTRNWKVTKVYREEGRSGKDTNRPQFQQMLQDIREGKVDTVVVKKIDRLSRSILDFEKTYNFFVEHNVDLVSLQENFDTTTAIGRAVIRIVLVFAQLEREQTSERTIDVLEYRAKQGLWNGGYPPLGYDIDDEKGLVVNKEEAAIVRMIFEKYLELASYKKVANYLNKLGLRTKVFVSRRGKKQGGKLYSNTTIARILKDPLYIGKVKYKDKIYQGVHQPIIDEDLFNQVQGIIEQNKISTSSIKRRPKYDFLLEGVVRCGVCKSIMSPRWATSKGTRYFYYECTSVGHRGKSACSVRSIPAKALEEVILKKINQINQNEILLQRILNEANSKSKKELEELEKERVLLNLRISELKQRGKRLVDKLLEVGGEYSRFIKEEMKEAEKELKELEEQLSQIKTRIEHSRNYLINAEVVKEGFQYFNRIFDDLSGLVRNCVDS